MFPSLSRKRNSFEEKSGYDIKNRWQWVGLSWILGVVFSGLYFIIVYLVPYISTDYRIFVPNRFIIEVIICIIPLASGLILTSQSLLVVEPTVSIEGEFLVLDSSRQVVAMSCLELVRVSGSVNTDNENEPLYNTSILLALQAGAKRNVNFAYEVGVVSGQPFLRFFVTASSKMLDDAKDILRKEATRIEAILLSTLNNIELHQLRDEKLERAVSIFNNEEKVDVNTLDTNVVLFLKGVPSVSPTCDSSQIGKFISTILKQGYSVSFTCVFSGAKPGRERRKLEGEWRSIRSKERNKEDSLADQAIKKKLVDRYELIQSNSGWFDSSTYIQISKDDTLNIQMVKEGLKGLILSLWGENSSITIDELSIDQRKFRRILTRRHLKSQRIHMSQLAAFVNTPVQPLPVISALDVPVFPVPAIEFIANEFPIGWAIFGGRRLNEVGLKTEWLREHVAVLGATGTGKTTLVRKLIAELSTKTDVPWWIFDVKGSEYSDLVALDNVIVLRPGLDTTFVIDLIDTESSSLINQAHATFSILKELLRENNSSDLSPAMEKLLRESVLEMADGIDGTYSVKSLTRIIKQKAGSTRSGTMTRDALLNRLEILTREPLGSILRGGPHALKISDLLQKRVVFDLRHVSRVGGMDAARLLYNLVAKRIFDSGMRRGIKSGLHHLVVLEEANNLVPESYTRHSAADVTTGESMVMLQRATGQGVIVVSTRPNISSNILANTSTKVTFRLPYDSSIGGRFMSISPEQEQYLRTLKRGRALMILPSVETFEIETMLFDISQYSNVLEDKVDDISVDEKSAHLTVELEGISTTTSKITPEISESQTPEDKTVIFDRLGEIASHVVAFLAPRDVTISDDIQKFLMTLDSRMSTQDISEMIRDFVSLSTIQREAISLVSGGFVYTLPGKGLESVRNVIVDYIIKKCGAESSARINNDGINGPDIILDDRAILVIPEHLKSSSMNPTLEKIRFLMSKLGNEMVELVVIVRGSVAAAKLREITDNSDEFTAVNVVSAFPGSLDKMIESMTYTTEELGVDDKTSDSHKVDLIEAVHEVGTATSRVVQMRLWFGLIQDFVDLSNGRVEWETLLEFIETTALQSLKGRTAPMNIDEGRRALTELLADEALVALRIGKEKEFIDLEEGLWIINATILKELRDDTIKVIEKKLSGRNSMTVFKNHGYYDLCVGEKSYVIFPTQQQLNTLIRVHSDIACRTCKSSQVICILTAVEYLDDSMVTPSNLIMRTMDDGLATVII